MMMIIIMTMMTMMMMRITLKAVITQVGDRLSSLVTGSPPIWVTKRSGWLYFRSVFMLITIILSALKMIILMMKMRMICQIELQPSPCY